MLFHYLSVLGNASFVSVLQLRILNNIFKIFQIQKYEIDIVLNIITGCKFKNWGIFYIL